MLPPAGLHHTSIQLCLLVLYSCAAHFTLRVGYQTSHFCPLIFQDKIYEIPAHGSLPDVRSLRHLSLLRELLGSPNGFLTPSEHLADHKASIMDVICIFALRRTAWFAPMAAGGLIPATVGGFTLHLLSGKVLLVASGIGYVVSVLLFAIILERFSY